ncbi:hypothetical protein EYE40_14570 [Glaciihabitans arcticus]|uniref:Uncharacterized protein n=1 Tax=Glaciihabitans arcticus TaxID=2668039 RepID=A0A4Q9GLY1_9MICO|nr:hypothetical protein [Glaciihabitans arcticus]TBN55429.1 hypothetical protein EYE40_14570 [Glaciihabitans arcticus]
MVVEYVIASNDLMRRLLPAGGDEYTYPRPLRTLLRQGISRESGGLFFGSHLRANRHLLSPSDIVGSEALINSFHIEDFVSAKLGVGSDAWARQCVGLAVQFGRDVLEMAANAFPQPIRIAITLDQGTQLFPGDEEGSVPSCTLRFWGIRPGVPEYFAEPSAYDTEPFLLLSRVES